MELVKGIAWTADEKGPRLEQVTLHPGQECSGELTTDAKGQNYKLTLKVYERNIDRVVDQLISKYFEAVDRIEAEAARRRQSS